MTTFLFQTAADHYDLRREPAAGETIWFPAQRYRTLMLPGSLVFFWLAGGIDLRGLHGWGRLVSPAFQEDSAYRVNVRFDHRIDPFVPAGVVRAAAILHNHPIFTVRVGSNFLLENDEAEALIALIPLHDRPVLEHS